MSADSVMELRQYTLRGGQRETLISLFEQKFVAPLNEAGCFVRGIFRDLDDPDRFVWFRSFANLESRKRALETFYDGPVWKTHRTAANATIVDSDNVLLLKPARSLNMKATQEQPARDAPGVYSTCLYYMNGANAEEFSAFFSSVIWPRLAVLGVAPRMTLQTETAANNFPRLPVREQERVFAWIGRWPSVEGFRSFQERWVAQTGWRDTAPVSVLPALMRKPEILRLSPTALSEWS